MRGLIYKELYLGRKTYFSFLALVLLFTILGILVCVSMICGNLQELAKDLEWKKTYATMFTYLPYILFLFSLNGSNQSIYKDYESRWMSYSYTLPTNAKVMVGSRYLLGVIIMVISLLYGIINAAIISVITKIPISIDVIKNMVIIMIVTSILYGSLVPLALKYKTSNAVSTRCVIVGAIIYLLTFVKMISIDRNGDIEEVERYYAVLDDKYGRIRDVLVPFSPLLIAVILLVSLRISMKIYQRREK